MMKSIISTKVSLCPIPRRLIVVVARGKIFYWIPKFGFYGKNSKTYFIIAFGRLYIGMRVVERENVFNTL